MNTPFNAVRRGTFAGMTAGSLLKFLESYLRVLFPESSAEWWSSNEYAKSSEALKSDSVMPSSLEIHHFGCYVRTGNESPIIEIEMFPKSGRPLNLTSIKLFVARETCWKMCDALDHALFSIFGYEEIPVIGEMFDKIPRQHSYSTDANLRERVHIEQTNHSYVVRGESGVVFDQQDFSDKDEYAHFAVEAHVKDWTRVLEVMKVDAVVSTTSSESATPVAEPIAA